jgi:hypothetical protein
MTDTRSLWDDVRRVIDLRENDPRDRGAIYGALPTLVEVAEAATLVASFHQAGGDEWWQAHSRLYAALNKLGIETPYAA